MRSRECESSVPLGYLQALHTKYESFFEKRAGSLVVDAEQGKDVVFNQVLKFIKGKGVETSI